MINQPYVEKSTKFNFITSIWLVPFIALIVAGWLIYQYYAELGPEIRITFPNNEGLQAGQSHIKYRDVPIGTITKIELQEDGKGVVVIARMDKTATPYLNEHSKFWIVKPEVGISGISGLDTLISGTYIKMYSQKGDMLKSSYKGLARAYRMTEDGTYFQLNTPKSYNLKIGTPIYYKNMVVGQVEYMPISLDNQSINIIIRIKNHYASYINGSSKFWINSMLHVDIDGGEVNVNVAPLSHLIQGGISFSSSYFSEKKIPKNHTFHLYKNAKQAQAIQLGEGAKSTMDFMIHTEHSIAKLAHHAPVQYEGFTIGEVTETQLSYNKKYHTMSSDIIFTLNTSAFKDKADTNHTGKENLYQAVTEGLRARVISSNPLIGTLFVDLFFEKNTTKKSIASYHGYAQIPLAKEQDDAIFTKIKTLLNTLNALPVDSLFHSLNQLIIETKKPVTHLDTLLLEMQASLKDIRQMTHQKSFTHMPQEINTMLKTLTKTLKVTKKVVRGYGSNSLLTHQITQTLKIVTETSKEMQHFLKMLNRKPNSLIFGDK